MDRRTLLALVLTAIVIVVTPILFPGPKRPPVNRDSVALADSLARRDTTAIAAQRPQATQPTVSATPNKARPNASAAPIVVAETTTVVTPHAVYRIANTGATPVSVTLPAYKSLRDSGGGSVELVDPGDRLLHLSVVSGQQMFSLDSMVFHAQPQRVENGVIVQAFTGGDNARGPVTLTYRFQRDSFAFRLDGSVGGTAPGSQLLVSLPRRVRSEERDQRDDIRHLSFGFKPGNKDAQGIQFRSIEPGQIRADSGAIRWVAERNKYFVIAAIPVAPDTAFRRIEMQGGPRVDKEATTAQVTAHLPLKGDAFSLRVFAGPQAWDHLRKTAPDLENVNPYGGWLHGVVQPFATIVMRLLLWIKSSTALSYGWVLVIFGIVVRVLLWPLNQNAMRSSMKLQRIQPELAALQKKHADNPERQRDAMLKLYQEHGMSPFTPVLGCLPMLLPMPILFALYFVFQNTIELRGVSFLWLPDLSLKDPYFITPLFMGISMFALSWIGMRGMPPNPQSKMMSYMMPVMFTVLFWNFASGLNLYYAVQNIAALPQQWLLARERTASPQIAPKGTARERG